MIRNHGAEIEGILEEGRCNVLACRRCVVAGGFASGPQAGLNDRRFLSQASVNPPLDAVEASLYSPE